MDMSSLSSLNIIQITVFDPFAVFLLVSVFTLCVSFQCYYAGFHWSRFVDEVGVNGIVIIVSYLLLVEQ